MSRLETLDLEQIELDGVTVVYSATDPASLEGEARRTGAFLAEAAGFFEARLGQGLHVIVAVLNARDFRTVSMGRHARTFSAPVDRLVVVPARRDGFVLEGGQDRTRAHRMLDVIRLHELSHAVAAAYLYPAGFDDDRPPVRWFDELIASYLAHAYMREAMPQLADFTQALARDMIRTGAPHFASLEAYERHYGEYMATPQGTSTLDWFHNVFNRRAAELYDEYGLDFFREIRRRLPWMRYELWTTDSLLLALEEIAPGFFAWAEELEYLAPRR
ncbi:MAG TPA: hypothetical protein VM778_05755 [Gemmatimonadota bacterium]|nr:hypothetical protein [Gemmatimonadota bacterium]